MDGTFYIAPARTASGEGSSAATHVVGVGDLPRRVVQERDGRLLHEQVVVVGDRHPVELLVGNHVHGFDPEVPHVATDAAVPKRALKAMLARVDAAHRAARKSRRRCRHGDRGAEAPALYLLPRHHRAREQGRQLTRQEVPPFPWFGAPDPQSPLSMSAAAGSPGCR